MHSYIILRAKQQKDSAETVNSRVIPAQEIIYSKGDITSKMMQQMQTTNLLMQK